jgi:hypothetical protein
MTGDGSGKMLADVSPLPGALPGGPAKPPADAGQSIPVATMPAQLGPTTLRSRPRPVGVGPASA